MNSQCAGNFNKSVSEPDGLRRVAERLRVLARRVPEPARGYFAGICRRDRVRLGNVLLFHRRRPIRNATASSHHRFVLILNLATAGTVFIDHVAFLLRPMRAILIFPYQFHQYREFGSTRISWLFVTFECHRPASLPGLKNIPLILSPMALQQATRLCGLFLSRRKVGTEADNRVPLACELLLEELRHTHAFSFTGKPCHAAPRGVIVDLAQQMGVLLEQQGNGALRIAVIARALGLSPGLLRNTFRVRMGISLGRYLRELRLHRALRWMGTTDLTFSQIAERCGYVSLFSFGRAFKRRMRMTPRDYRRRLRALS